jgi:hypothetical protein
MLFRGWEEVERWRVRVGSGECGRLRNVAARSVGLENPPVTEVSRQYSCLIGQLVADQPAARHGRGCVQSLRARTVHRHSIGAARCGSINDEFSTTPPGCRRRNLPTRMTGCASPSEKQCRAAETIRHAVRLRIPTRVSQLAGRRRALRGVLDEGQIVDQPHQDAGQPQRLTAAQTDPLHWLLAVDRPRLHHHAGRCRRCGIARLTEPEGRAGWSDARRADIPLVLNRSRISAGTSGSPKFPLQRQSVAKVSAAISRRLRCSAISCPLHAGRATYRYSTIDITSRDSSSASWREIGSSSSGCAPTA